MIKLIFFNFLLFIKNKTLFVSMVLYFLYIAIILIITSIINVDINTKNLYYNKIIDIFSINIIIVSIIQAIATVILFSSSDEDGSSLIIISKAVARWKYIYAKLIVLYLHILIMIIINIVLISFIFWIKGSYNPYTNPHGFELDMFKTIIWTQPVAYFFTANFFIIVALFFTTFSKKTYVLLFTISIGIIFNFFYIIVPLLTGKKNTIIQEQYNSLLTTTTTGKQLMYTIDPIPINTHGQNFLSYLNIPQRLVENYHLNDENLKTYNRIYSQYDEFPSIEYKLYYDKKIFSDKNNLPYIMHLDYNGIDFLSNNTQKQPIINNKINKKQQNLDSQIKITYQDFTENEKLIFMCETFYKKNEWKNIESNLQYSDFVYNFLFNENDNFKLLGQYHTFLEQNNILVNFLACLIYYTNFKIISYFTIDDSFLLSTISFNSTEYTNIVDKLNNEFLKKFWEYNTIYLWQNNTRNNEGTYINAKGWNNYYINIYDINNYIMYETNYKVNPYANLIAMICYQTILLISFSYIVYRKDIK